MPRRLSLCFPNMRAFSDDSWLSQVLRERAKEVVQAVDSGTADVLATRRPLVRKGTSKAAEVKLYNPRFEEDFAAGKDYDPDRYISGSIP